jgi:TolB-like protein/DNA-binding winged helix-turn-helix (wHTH) protein/Tfp pilus assembly protein PilF
MSAEGRQPIAFDDGFRVGDFEVYPKRLALVRDGESIRLEPKVMAVLVHLAERAGEVVTRNEFADEVWRGRIVSDEVLSRDISILRSQLGDRAKEPSYVLTIPRVGYRLIAPVTPLQQNVRSPEPSPPAEAVAATPTPHAEPPPELAPASQPRAPRPWHPTVGARAAMIVFSIAALAGLAWYFFDPGAGPAGLPTTNIAVLPFASLSETTDDEFFGDGLADEIRHALGGVDGLHVVARTSSFAFRNSREDIRAIGQKLGAGSLLEGSVRRDGNRLRITAQLIDANSGLQAWSESYDRRLSDIFDVQNEISTAIASKLVGTLSPDARLTPPTHDIDAYQLFLRANHLMRRRGADHLNRSVALFLEAIEKDPAFGRAYAGLAEAYTLQPSYSGSSEKTAHALALAAAEKAEALGEGTARARGVRAFLHFRSREWSEARNDFEAAIAASPNDADLQQWYSQFLANVGWIEASARAARAAVTADPLSPVANQRAGVIDLWTGQHERAARYFSIAAELGIHGPGLPEAYVAFLLREGRVEEARQWLLEAQAIRGQGTSWIDPALGAIAQNGSKQAALDALDASYRASELGVRMYVGALFFIGDVDGLFDAMRNIVASGEPFDIELFFTREGRRIRQDDRFLPLMRELGLVAFWDANRWPDECHREGERAVCN